MDKERMAALEEIESHGAENGWVALMTEEDREFFAYFRSVFNRYNKVLNGHNIVVDLIVHKRGYDEQRGFDNLFCIEMKKAYKRCDLSSDKERLRILTDNFCGFGYKAGFMITATADKIHDEYKLVVESAFYNHSEN